MNPITELEKKLFSCTSKKEQPSCIFILGSPRTGSTILYQAITKVFNLPYISNLTNDYFPDTPSVGLSITAGNQQAINIDGLNKFGKTEGVFQPSEGSAVMRNWFGGGHPSQIKSRWILDNKISHMRDTLSFANHLHNAPLVIKNAWNCFRIECLSSLFPNAYFIWIRRDIGASAKSDLKARYVVQNDPLLWNSATPANVESLKEKPYWEQVVENQYVFNNTISNDLNKYAQNRFCEVWYEDFITAPQKYFEQLQSQYNLLAQHHLQSEKLANLKIEANKTSLNGLSYDDSQKIDTYITQNVGRLFEFLHTK